MRRAIAIYDCTADGDGELSFKEGDILIDVTESVEDGWYIGLHERSLRKGLFPYNYVEFIADSISASRAFPESDRPDSSQEQKQHENRASIPPPGSTLSSTWCIISAKGSQEDVENKASTGNKAAPKSVDAFEKAMNQKPIASRTTEKPPALAPKPSQFKDTMMTTLALTANSEPSTLPRVKTQSAGLPTPPIQAPALKNEPFPILRPKPSTHLASKAPDVTEEDGFQIVTLPHFRQHKAGPFPAGMANPAGSLAKPSAKDASRTSKSIFSDLQASRNPAPRLPSRPTANKRRPPKSTTTRTCATTASAPSKAVPVETPVNEKFMCRAEMKQKPVLANTTAPFQKARSASNPPPIQPKPSFSKPVVTSTTSSFGLPTAGGKQQDTPRSGSLPSSTAIALPGLSSSLPGSRPPKGLYSSGFSASPGSLNRQEVSRAPSSVLSSTAIPLPGLASDLSKRAFKSAATRQDGSPPASAASSSSPTPLSGVSSDLPTHVSVASRLEQWQQKSQDTPTTHHRSRPNKSSGWKPPATAAVATESAVKKAQAPKSSTVAQNIHRYEDLFNKIHDDGVVDGQTAKVIWERSKVSDETLAQIWRQCDPQGDGKLGKSGFIKGLREIDALLAQSEKVECVMMEK